MKFGSWRGLTILVGLGAWLAAWSICLAEGPQQPNLYEGAVAVGGGRTIPAPLDRLNPTAMKEAPLKEVIQRIEEVTGRQVLLDVQAIADSGIDISRETIIPEFPAGVPLADLVDLIPMDRKAGDPPRGLSWVVEEYVLRLTSSEVANTRCTTERYFVGDLLPATDETDWLVDFIESQTSGPWDADEPGTGTISRLGNFLFVRQTQGNQHEIHGILEALHQTAPMILLFESQEDLRIRRIMEEKVIHLERTGITLAEFVKQISEMTGVTVRLDEQALIDAGVDVKRPIDVKAINVPWWLALERNLANMNGSQLTAVIEDGVLKITSLEKACECYETILYNVESFEKAGAKLGDLISLIERETTGPWDADEPGTGMIWVIPHRHMLVVRQTAKVQREIMVHLSKLRHLPQGQTLFRNETKETQQLITRFYRLSPETAKAMARIIPNVISTETWAKGDSVESENKNDRMGKLTVLSISSQDAPVESIGPNPWKAPQEGRASGGDDQGSGPRTAVSYLAVTHTIEVQGQIEELLKLLCRRPADAKPEAKTSGFFQVVDPSR